MVGGCYELVDLQVRKLVIREECCEEGAVFIYCCPTLQSLRP